MYRCVSVHTMGVEVKEQRAGISSFLLPCGSEGSNSGCQIWWQVLLPTEPPHQPLAYNLNLLLGAEQLWDPQNHRRLFLVWEVLYRNQDLTPAGLGCSHWLLSDCFTWWWGPASSYHGHGEQSFPAFPANVNQRQGYSSASTKDICVLLWLKLLEVIYAKII